MTSFSKNHNFLIIQHISIFLFATLSLKHALSRYFTHKSNACIRKYCDIFVLGSMGLDLVAIFWIFLFASKQAVA